MSEAVDLAALLVLNAAFGLGFLHFIYPSDGWVSPIAPVLLFYMLHYPVRALILFTLVGTPLECDVEGWGYAFMRAEIVPALLYATLFMGALLVFYALLCRSRRGWWWRLPLERRSGLETPWRRQVFFAMFCGYFLAFGYRAARGDLFGLYHGLEDLKQAFLVNLLGVGLYAKYFLLAYALLRMLRDKSACAVLLALSMLLSILTSALVSTGKGQLVDVVIVWLMCVWMCRLKLPKLNIVLMALAILVFAFYSYTARRYGTVRSGDESTVAVVRENIRIFTGQHQQDEGLWKTQLGPVFSRFDGLDGLILCQRENRVLETGLYGAGSVVEIGNLVPRILWPTRPHLSFNHHLTSVVWGRPSWLVSEMPIGRIGESFFVLNWVGLLYAIVYASIWNWIYTRFMVRADDDTSRAFYVYLACLVIIPDAYLTYNLKSALIVSFFVWFLRSNVGTRPKVPAHLTGFAMAGGDPRAVNRIR